VAAKGRPDLHQLEGGLQLLHQHVGFDGPLGKAKMPFERAQEVVPESGLLGGLDLGQVEDKGSAALLQGAVIVDHVQSQVDNGGRE